MSADPNDPRHLRACQSALAESERMLTDNRARNARLVADNDALRQAIDAAIAELEGVDKRMPQRAVDRALSALKAARGET